MSKTEQKQRFLNKSGRLRFYEDGKLVDVGPNKTFEARESSIPKGAMDKVQKLDSTPARRNRPSAKESDDSREGKTTDKVKTGGKEPGKEPGESDDPGTADNPEG